MVVDKTTLTTDFPDSSDLTPNETGTSADADVVNLNTNTILGWVTDLFNFCLDQSPQTGVATTYTALQNFGAGITTDAIGTYTAGGNLLVTTTGSGVLNYASGSVAASQVLTVGNYSALVGPAAGVTDMTGATSGADGAHGLAIKPLAGEQNEALMGDATWRPVVRSTVDTLNTGAMAAGKTFVGTGANATAPDFVPTLAAAFDVTNAALAGKSIVASSASVGIWDFVPTVDAALDLTGTPTSGQIPVASSASAAAWTTINANSIPVGLICEGRLTLTSATPITTAPVTAATTVYFTPYLGGRIALYDGSTAWNIRSFAELSIAVPATTVTPFDIFCYDNGGVATLEVLSWTNDTTRATALTFQNGIYVKTGATTRRYLGTGRTTAVSGQTQVTASSCLLWNYYNRLPRFLTCQDTTASWTYTTAAWRGANNSAVVGTARVESITGVAENITNAYNGCSAGGDNGGLKLVGIGLNSSTVNSAQVTFGCNSNDANFRLATSAYYKGFLAAGYNYLQRLETVETATGTVTWLGRAAGNQADSAMVVDIFA